MKNFFRRRSISYEDHGNGSAGRSFRLHWFFKTILVFYFALCFVILGARWFFTTQVDSFREDIVELVSKAAGIDVRASHFSADFRYLWPTVMLENVELARPGGPVSLVLPKVEARISWTSLWHLEPRFQLLSVKTPKLTIRRLSETKFDIAGVVVELTDNAAEGLPVSADTAFESRLLSWFLAQHRLELIDGTITYIDERRKNARPVVITHAGAVLSKDLLDWKAAVEGRTVLHQEQDEYFCVRANVKKHLFSKPGNPLTWEGSAYAKVSHADIASLLRGIGLPRLMRSGVGAAEVWADFKEGHITSATADIAINNLDTLIDQNLEPLRFRWLTGRLRFSEEPGDNHRRTLNVDNLDFLTYQGLRLGETDISASLSTDPSGEPFAGHFSASRIDIGSLASLVPRLPLPDEARTFVNNHRPSGLLKAFSLSFSGNPRAPENWQVAGEFSKLALRSGKTELPGFHNISGRVSPLSKNGGVSVELDSRDARLVFPGIFRRPTMQFDKLHAGIEIRFTPVLTLSFKSVEAENREAAASGSGTWTAEGGPAGTINIGGKIQRGRAEAVPYYIPIVCGDGVLDWLEAGILGGTGSHGTWTVRGPLHTFPWDGKEKGQGLFLIEADVRGGKLDFLPSHQKNPNGTWKAESQWPLLTNISAHLRFEGNGMWITGQSARSMGLKASEVEVSIPSYSEPTLYVKGKAAGDLSQAIRYLNKGVMLRDLLSGAFDQSRGSGPVEVAMDLKVPLDAPKKTTVAIDADFNKASFYYGLNLPTAESLTGRLHITEKSVTTSSPILGVTASGHPLSVVSSTERGRICLDVETTATPDELEKLLDLPGTVPFSKLLTGSAFVKTHTEIGLTSSYLGITGSTTLRGITSMLPPPFAKTADDIWETTFSFLPSESGREIRVQSPGRAELALGFDERAGHMILKNGFIGIGREPLRPIRRGLDIAVRTEDFSVSTWKPLIEASLADINGRPVPKNQPSARELITTVEAKIDSLSWGSKVFRNVDATLRRFNPDDWHLRLAGDQAAGQIEYRHGKTAESLIVKLNRLHLPEESEDSFTDTFRSHPSEPADLPDVSLVIDDLQVGKKQIGKVELKAANQTGTVRRIWDISDLVIRNAGGTLTGRGRWSRDPGQRGETELSLSARVTDAGKLLSSLSVQDAVRGAPGKMEAAVSWQGAPYSPDFASLNGSITGETGAGQLLQIEPGAGRLLSLLSMQHLLKRLTLDFRDVLSRGFAFDSMSMSGTIRNGVYTTPKSSVLGSAATVVMGGDIDLVREKLDLKAVILPSINAGGPSLALALVNPAVGIGTFVTQWLFKDQLSQMFRMEYAVSGSFDDPVVTKIERVRPDSDLSAFSE